MCAFALAAGNLHDQAAARRIMEAFKGIHFVGNNGLDSLSFRKALDEHGTTGSIIPRKGFLRGLEDKTAASFAGFIILAAIPDRLHCH